MEGEEVAILDANDVLEAFPLDSRLVRGVFVNADFDRWRFEQGKEVARDVDEVVSEVRTMWRSC